MLKKYSTTLTLSLILALAIVFRFYRLSEFPVGLHGDEASLSYNAYSILLTGKDENGDFLPIHSYISRTYRPIGYTYLTVPSVFLFGLNEFSARFPGALLGTFTVVAIYFLALLLFNKKSTALAAAFILAINPWHVGLSRASSETLAALFFVVCGFICVVKMIQRKKSSLYLSIVSLILFTISFITYPAPRVFVPVFLLLLLPIVYFKTKSKIKLFLILTISTFCISAFFILGTKGGAVKFNDVGLFSYELPYALLLESIREDGMEATQPFISRAFHNKVTAYGQFFVKEYMKYYSYPYLVEGEIFPIRYQISNTGLIYIIEGAFLLIGIYYVFRQRTFALLFVFCWIIVGPLAAALTWEDTPNILRSIPMLVGLVLLIAMDLPMCPCIY